MDREPGHLWFGVGILEPCAGKDLLDSDVVKVITFGVSSWTSPPVDG